MMVNHCYKFRVRVLSFTGFRLLAGHVLLLVENALAVFAHIRAGPCVDTGSVVRV